MRRSIFGIEFEGERLEDTWEVRTWRANGVMERSARQVIQWKEIGFGLPPPLTHEEYLAWLREEHKYEPEKLKKLLAMALSDEEDRKARCLKKAAQRAKQACRRTIIAEGFDELLTLTYRENQIDRDLCKKHFKEWVRRMKRALGGYVDNVDEDGVIIKKWVEGDFRYCASFERQERGAMHVHLAVHKLPKHAVFEGVKVKGFELGTKVWHSVVGKNNGLCYVGAKGRFGVPRRDRMSLAKMAGYVSKYIMKDYEDSPAGSNRYSRSNGLPLVKSEVMVIKDCTFLDLLILTFEQGQGDIVVSHRVGHFKDSMWLCVESRGERYA